MSYSNTFQDYLRDIPMEIGLRFYPPPAINLPTLTIPVPVKNVQYVFDAERRARQQYDEANSEPMPKPEQLPKNPVNGLAASGSLSSSATSLTSEVLLPSTVAPASAPLPRPPAPIPKPLGFEEFEGRGTVFDELEWKTIDDKAALSQILGNVSLEPHSERNTMLNSVAVVDNQSKAPQMIANGSKSVVVPAIPSYPVLDFGTRSKSEEPTVKLTTTGDMNTAVFTKPVLSAPVKGPKTLHESPLRVRLLTKGYRENLVVVALERIPREQLPYVEYYMKGMSILEKRGVEPVKTVVFLLDSNLSEKQAIVPRAQTAEQLIGMGFSAEKVFPALLSSQGDRVKALDTLLGSR